MRRYVDEKVWRVAKDQHFAFTWMQAQAAGANRQLAARRVAAGLWLHPARTVYLLAASPDTWRRQLKAAELSVPGSAVSGLPALELFDLPGGAKGEPRLTVPTACDHRTPLAVVRRSDLVTTTRVDGFRVVTPEQLVFDHAAHFSMRGLEPIIDGALLSGRTSVARLQERLRTLSSSRLPGIAKVQALIAERSDGFVVPESVLERYLSRGLRLAGVPGVVLQAHPPWDPSSRRRFDALSAPWRTIYEADGRAWHARVRDFERDRRRDLEAAAHGFQVLRFTWAMLTEGLDEVVDLVRSAGVWRAA